MIRNWMIGLGAMVTLGLGAPTMAADPVPVAEKPPLGDMTAPDYAKDTSWICRPGVDDGTCSTNLDAIAIDAQGNRSPVTWKGDPNAPIDCFYVYPTVSNDPTFYSDMNVGPEERRTVHAQTARLGSVCKVYVPAYHQVTATVLGWLLKTGSNASTVNFDPPYADILAAWRYYLAHDNHGRGVVIVGHSQGAVLLKRLLAEQIDGKPAQKLLVAAYLAGNLDVTDKSFKAVRPCASMTQTGCVVAWSTALDTDSTPQLMGQAKPGTTALCVDPAAPGGGRGLLKSFLSKPAMAPASAPPYVETIGQLSAQCVQDAGGTMLRVHVESGPYADILGMGLHAAMQARGFGLHILDINLVQGNLLDLIASQSAAWAAKR